jgi:hypothetical protein
MAVNFAKLPEMACHLPRPHTAQNSLKCLVVMWWTVPAPGSEFP